MRQKTLRTCAKGHKYTKSTDCPTCPVCEAERAPSSGLPAGLSAPARRALEREGITTAARLAQRSEAEILALHGIGPTAIPKLRSSLAAAGLKFKK